ncbi:MAG: helix-turn-helix transcriptional regulator [Candidatus Kryptonium sp.]
MEEKTIYVSIIPDVIRFFRESAGMSVHMIARMLRMDEDEYLDLENGKKKLTIEEIKRLAKVLGRPVSDFFLSDIPGEESYDPLAVTLIMNEVCDRFMEIKGVIGVWSNLRGRKIKIGVVVSVDDERLREEIARLKEEFDRRYPDVIFELVLVKINKDK